MTAEEIREKFLANVAMCKEMRWACTKKGCKAKERARRLTTRQWENIAAKANRDGYVNVCQEIAKRR